MRTWLTLVGAALLAILIIRLITGALAVAHEIDSDERIAS